MTQIDEAEIESSPVKKLPLAAAVFAVAGLVDAVYLTVHHLTAEPVPCNLFTGCETVLSSQYAEIAGIPLATFGAVAYFVAFSLAVLAAFGDRRMWTLFGIQVVLMSIFTTWLLYLQAVVIGAFCQFCLISAITTFSMLVIFIVSRLARLR